MSGCNSAACCSSVSISSLAPFPEYFLMIAFMIFLVTWFSCVGDMMTFSRGLTSLLSDAPPRMPELEPGRNRRVHCSSLVRRQIQKPKNPFFSGVGGGASHSNVSRATPTDQAEYTNRIGVDQRSGVTVPCV